jgi:hypothetical protein
MASPSSSRACALRAGPRWTGSSFLPGVLCCLVVLQAGCGQGAPGDAGQWTVDTLANGLVRVSNPGTPHPLPGAPTALEPRLRLGVAEGPQELIFGQVAGAVAHRDGRIYVLDRQANELRIFSPEGVHLRTVGRQGSGPGEYIRANGLQWADADVLMVVDQEGGRYTFLDPEGELLGSARRELGFWGWVFSGVYHEGRVLEVGVVSRPGGSSESAILALPAAWDGEGGDARADTVILPANPHAGTATFSVRGEFGGMNMSVPHAPRRPVHLDPDGHLWHGYGGEFRIFQSTLAGDTLREIRATIDPVPVHPDEIREWRASENVERFLELGGELDMDRIPDTKPFFDGFYRDPDGYLWVSVPVEEGSTRFVVLDLEGRFVADLHLPGVDRSPGVPPFVQGDWLYLVARDDFDVEGVEAFRIIRE